MSKIEARLREAFRRFPVIEESPVELFKEAADRIKELEKQYNAPFISAVKCQEKLKVVEAQLDAQQARIDALMLEYCPGEMTVEQLSEWEKNQVEDK